MPEIMVVSSRQVSSARRGIGKSRAKTKVGKLKAVKRAGASVTGGYTKATKGNKVLTRNKTKSLSKKQVASRAGGRMQRDIALGRQGKVAQNRAAKNTKGIIAAARRQGAAGKKVGGF